MRKTSSIHLSIEPVRLAITEEKIGPKNLMVHQAQLRKTKEKLVILNAPTSSGKTLACLSRVIHAQDEDAKKRDAIFLYPTNELMWDQANSMSKILQMDLGKKVEVVPIDPQTQEISYPSSRSDNDFTLLLANGDSLATLAEEEDRAKGSILMRLLQSAKGQRILLTNIDLLFNIFKSKFTKSRTLMREIQEFKILVIDEFHLYQGVMLANLLFLLWPLRNIFDQIILSSATHDPDVVASMAEMFSERRFISPTVSIDATSRIVRHKVELEITHSNHILFGQEDTERITKIVVNLHSECIESEADVKVLVLVNSVSFCDMLFRRLREQFGETKVGAIHGFVPHENRRHSGLDILVGTRSVDVGIDFDAASLIFEATDAATFMQRLGRGGRHRDCKAVAIIPTTVFLYLSFEEGDVLSYEQLEREINSKMGLAPSYADFLKSEEAAYLYVGLLYGIARELDKTKYIQVIREASLDSSWKPPFIQESHVEKAIFLPKMLNVISSAGARGDILSLPAYHREYETFFEIGVFDLPKLDFQVYWDLESFRTDIGKKIPRTIKKGPIVLINRLSEKPSRLQGYWDHSDKIKIINEGYLGLDLEPRLGKELKKLLEDKLAYSTYSKDDWRFPAILSKTDRGLYLVVGLEALLQKYLDRK